jgi:NTP pyrophosphatase (non-canonical NTP hydrolase)
MLQLKTKPTLADFQQYVRDMETERGFTEGTLLQACLMLGEEVGELFKAVRKLENMKFDHSSKIGSAEEELADILIYLCSIANRLNIDIEKAFRDKEAINKGRQWRNSTEH